jgi:hypothetical protein
MARQWRRVGRLLSMSVPMIRLHIFLVAVASLFLCARVSALAPATPLELKEWLRAVEVNHPGVIRMTTPQVLLGLSRSSELGQLDALNELPLDDPRAFPQRPQLRDAIGNALRRLEREGHLKETVRIDAIVFGKARNLASSREEPFHAAFRMARTNQSAAFYTLCETLLLVPWRDHGKKEDAKRETGSSIRAFDRQSLRLYDLLEDKGLLERFCQAAEKRVRAHPESYKSVQAYLYAHLLLRGDAEHLWEDFVKAMPNQNTWRREPLVSLAYFCHQRGIPAPHLHSSAGKLIDDAPHRYSALGPQHSAELHLLAAGNAIFESDFARAKARHVAARADFAALEGKKMARFLDDHARLLVESLSDPALNSEAEEWVRAFAGGAVLRHLSHEGVLGLWEWAIARESSRIQLKGWVSLADAMQEHMVRDLAPYLRSAEFRRSYPRHLFLLLRAGKHLQAGQFQEGVMSASQEVEVGGIDLEAFAKRIDGAKIRRSPLLWRATQDTLVGVDHWLKMEGAGGAVSAELFPVAVKRSPERAEFYQGEPPMPMPEETEVIWREGFAQAPLPAKRDSPWLAARFEEDRESAEGLSRCLIPLGPNLISDQWTTCDRDLPGLSQWIVERSEGLVRITNPLGKKSTGLSLLSAPMPLEEAMNYSFSGTVRSFGRRCDWSIAIELLDEAGEVVGRQAVTKSGGSAVSPERFFQILLVRDTPRGPAFRLPIGAQSVRVVLKSNEGMATSFENLVLSRYALSDPSEIVKPRNNIDVLASTYLEFSSPVDALATNPRHGKLAVAVGGEGKVNVYRWGRNEPFRTYELPRNVSVPWLAYAEDGTIGSLTLRPRARKHVFYVFTDGRKPIVVPTERTPILPTLDRSGRWLLWLDEEKGQTFVNYHNLRDAESTTVRKAVDLPHEREVLFIASIWTSKVFAFEGSDFRWDYSLPEMTLKKAHEEQAPIEDGVFKGLYRAQYGTFLFNACALDSFRNLIGESQGKLLMNSPGDRSLKTIDKRSGRIVRSANLSSPAINALPVYFREGFLERDLIFTLEEAPQRVLRLDRPTLREAKITL